MDQYKKEKTALKSWVETHSGLKRVSWLIVYVPKGSQTPDMYQKIYAKVSNEFCQDKTGDRSCMVLHSKHFKSLQAHSTSFMEVTAKIRDGVVQSFQQRLYCY